MKTIGRVVINLVLGVGCSSLLLGAALGTLFLLCKYFFWVGVAVASGNFLYFSYRMGSKCRKALMRDTNEGNAQEKVCRVS